MRFFLISWNGKNKYKLLLLGILFLLVVITLIWVKFPYFYITFHLGLDFYERQNRYPRVQKARTEKEEYLRNKLREEGISYPPHQIFLRAFKRERQLEVWARETEKAFQKIHTYSFKGFSGTIGPKRKQGDKQIPEGVYVVNRYNPKSDFYLSLGLNYPNRSDQILGDTDHPGSNIFIHGDGQTVGCIPIGTDNIKELYILALDTKEKGQQEIPVHIYPTRLNERNLANLKKRYDDRPELLAFWLNLREVFRAFETHHRLPDVEINRSGRYHIK